MKVLVVGPAGPDTFADNVASTLRSMGAQVETAGSARPSLGPHRLNNALHIAAEHAASLDLRLQRPIPRQAERFRPDLVISVDSRLRPETVRALRRHAGNVVLWFPDAVSSMGRHEMFLAPYDRIYLKMRPLVRQLQDIYGLPVAYLPEGANSQWHRPIGEYGTRSVIVLAGNVHPTRALLLERLLDAGIPLEIYGGQMGSWMDFPRLRQLHTGRAVLREDKSRAFRAARGVLNNLHPAELAGSNNRLFEATASGAAVLTEWRPEMAEMFEPEREVLRFSDFDTLVSLCRRLLADAEFGRPIADAAASRAAAQHTIQHRLQSMMEDLDLDSLRPRVGP